VILEIDAGWILEEPHQESFYSFFKSFVPKGN